METSKNKKILKELEKLAVLRQIQGLNRQLFANQNAIDIIERLDFEITSGNDLLGKNKIAGIGKGIAKHIDEILDGGIPELNNLSDEEKEKVKVLRKFMKIPGIGFKKAMKYYKEGKRKVKELNLETKYQSTGFEYYKEFQKRIPREKIDQFKEYFSSLFSKKIKFEICGSYRRGNPDSGDIDILVWRSHSKRKEKIPKLKKIVKKIDKIVETFQTEDTQRVFHGVVNLGEDLPAAHLDIYCIQDLNELPYGLLYLTGNAVLNRRMRSIARKKGYKLGSFEMKSLETDEKVILNSEREIFEFLDMEYLEPNERNL